MQKKMPLIFQCQRIPVWVGHILGLNRWVYFGASDQFQAANLDSGRSTRTETMTVNTESVIGVRVDSFP